MSELILVRHGQARFFEDNYDQLSDLGVLQVRRLAEYWRRIGLTPDALYCGPLERQRESAGEVYRQLLGSGVVLPEPRVMAEWAEYDGSLLVTAWQREMAAREPALANPGRRAMAADRAAHAKSFQRAYEVLMRQWVAGERVVDGASSWAEFKARVSRGLDAVAAAHPRGARAAVFSSGGAIAVALGRVLGLDDQTTLELNWVIRNCAISELLYNRDKISLSSFNCTPHLEPELLTYR